MTELISTQLIQIITMFICGMSIGMIFDVQSFTCRFVLRYKRLYALAYLIFWLISSWLFAAFLYKCSHGALSVHAVITTIFGYAFYKFILKKYY